MDRTKITHPLMGKMVHVEVDRPIGYLHSDMLYPINYGFIPGVMAGDGEEQDAYILGVSKPLAAFDGRVVGIIRRQNDCEDKLVVAPDGMLFHQGQIAAATHFQEKYFQTTINALYRKACGVIPFRRTGSGIEFLLLFQHRSQTWSFPKGHMEAEEAELETALREITEETGLHPNLIPDMRITATYPVPPFTQKQVVLFPGEVSGDPLIQKAEIECFRWVSFEDFPRYLYPELVEALAPLKNL